MTIEFYKRIEELKFELLKTDCIEKQNFILGQLQALKDKCFGKTSYSYHKSKNKLKIAYSSGYEQEYYSK